MLPINLHDLLHQRTVESEHIEYKAGLNLESNCTAFVHPHHMESSMNRPKPWLPLPD